MEPSGADVEQYDGRNRMNVGHSDNGRSDYGHKTIGKSDCRNQTNAGRSDVGKSVRRNKTNIGRAKLDNLVADAKCISNFPVTVESRSPVC